MGLRINTNVASINAQRNLAEASGRLGTSLERLSSGKRINRAGDDAAGLATSESIRAKIRGIRQAMKNSNDGISMVQVAEGGLNETTNILIRLRELAIQGASDTVGQLEKSYLDEEYTNLKDEINRIANTTTFKGRELLTGSGGEGGEEGGMLDIQVGETSSDFSRIQFDASKADSRWDKLGAESGTTIMASAVFDKEQSLLALESIDESLEQVNKMRAQFGAMQSRFQSAISNARISIENQSAAYSRIADADVAFESSDYTRNMIISQAATSVLSNANEYTKMALNLL
jgi:flagellin